MTMKEQKQNRALGISAEKLVQGQLWRNGHSVKNVSKFADYDLLVNDTIKVEVKSSEHKTTGNNLFWVFQGLKVKPHTADVLAIVITTPLNDRLIFYSRINDTIVKSWDEGKLLTCDKMVGGGIKCKLRITPDILKRAFTDSPASIFNK